MRGDERGGGGGGGGEYGAGSFDGRLVDYGSEGQHPGAGLSPADTLRSVQPVCRPAAGGRDRAGLGARGAWGTAGVGQVVVPGVHARLSLLALAE